MIILTQSKRVMSKKGNAKVHRELSFCRRSVIRNGEKRPLNPSITTIVLKLKYKLNQQQALESSCILKSNQPWFNQWQSLQATIGIGFNFF